MSLKGVNSRKVGAAGVETCPWVLGLFGSFGLHTGVVGNGMAVLLGGLGFDELLTIGSYLFACRYEGFVRRLAVNKLMV